MRITVRWLATPTRTRLPTALLPNSSRSTSLSAASSTTSPSRTASEGERQHGGALGDDRAVDARLHGGHEPRLDVEADDVAAAGAAPTAELEVGVGVCE